MKIKLAVIAIVVVSSLLFISISASSPNQPNYNPVGYEWIENKTDVLHIWNTQDDYYFNASSGIQLTNHYNDYWTHNYFCGSRGSAEYCTDALPFLWSVSSDNATYVKYEGYYANQNIEFRLTYYLAVNDTNITITPHVKNKGFAPFGSVKFAWKMKDIRILGTPENDYFYAPQGNSVIPYRLNETLNLTYKNFSNPEIRLDELYNNVYEALQLFFDNSTNYTITVKSEPSQYNAPVTLYITVPELAVGQNYSTRFGWIDREAVCSYGVNVGEVFVNFSRTAEINETNTETPFNMSVMWAKGPSLFDGQCNMYFDQSASGTSYNTIGSSYPSSSRSVFKGIEWYGFSQGQQTDDDIWYNVTMTCGNKHSSSESTKAHLNGWVAGVDSFRNFSCIDTVKPSVAQVSPLNNSLQNSTTVFKCSASDNTGLSKINLWSDWTGSWQLNETASYGNLVYGVQANFTKTLPDGIYMWACEAEDTNPSNDQFTDNWTVEIGHIVVDENEARTAILQGIANTIPASTVTSDQQLYVVNESDNHSTGRFDEVAVLNNQTWGFNYLTGSEQFVSVPSLLNIVNVWQNQSLTYTQLVKSVEQIINSTT